MNCLCSRTTTDGIRIYNIGLVIDKRNLRRVIHYDLPKSIGSYSQAIGRAGRDGAPASCEVLANRDSLSILENHEIQRIRAMVDFFESDGCLSRALAQYFGDNIGKDRCSHCSVCGIGRAVIAETVMLRTLSALDFRELAGEFVRAARKRSSIPQVTKFPCGVTSPLLMKLSARKLQHFGVLEQYPFLEVRRCVADSL